jgi:AmiR/NasT family two-component response regulator
MMGLNQPDPCDFDVLWVAVGALIYQRSRTHDEALERLLSMALCRGEPVEEIAERVVVLASIGCVLEEPRF